MTELKKIQITEKISPVQRLEELIMLNCPHYSKYTFNTITVTVTMVFFSETSKF